MAEDKKHPMGKLKDQLRNILKVIPSGSKIYYLDYPLHTNVGDLLIYKGSEKFFENNNIKVKARYSVFNFPQNLSIPKDCIIVFHGGGNFGDLWVSHQHFRESVISKYSHHRIVILPQTLYFKDNNNYIKAKKLFSKHPDLHIYARDKRSLNQLKGFSKNLYLSPDMAHELWPLTPSTPSQKKPLYLLRRDKEVNKNNRFKIGTNQDVFDWNDLVTKKDSKRVQEIKKEYQNKKVSNAVAWSKFSDSLINKAVSLFSTHNNVITTRLHGHILACLLNKENTLYDNSYGKNYQYYRTWTHQVNKTKFIK
ncbi:polysaccharide pyruvyl transferase family protein [Priestia megaterium]|uniref:polysaccharide pyruvyl transferase family protein n=1 Tax=Priestia megaterium TaxID=1404 RepID=UPI002D7FF0AC|nr:polysaccharide pyruvyl transferase family protein [Priestia megaterium]MEB4871367.1 polysaccharide pyruvyl transferase family protein [Priestia megaterium]